MIELQYFERSDFKQLINWVESPEFLVQFSGPGFQYPLDENQLEAYIENANKADSDKRVYKVVDGETGSLVGHISLGAIDLKNGSARIGRVLVGDKSTRGKGIGQQMIREVLKIAFDELHMHRVSLGVFDFNTSAIACYEKSGFTKEGLLRDSRKVGGSYWSLWEMSILEHEWMDLKKRDSSGDSAEKVV